MQKQWLFFLLFMPLVSQLLNAQMSITADQIVPVIKSANYALAIEQQVSKQIGTEKTLSLVYEKYNDQLIIVYAIDLQSGTAYLNQSNLENLHIHKDSLRPLAIRNLDRILTTKIELQGKDGKYMFTSGGDYEASMILLDHLWTKEKIKIDGDFVIAIPNRDLLLITGSDDKAGILKIKNMASSYWKERNYPVSEFLFKRNGTTFEKFE